jgi:hypothetical protein
MEVGLRLLVRILLILSLRFFLQLCFLNILALMQRDNLSVKAVNASLDANVRTPEIQVEGGNTYGTTEVGKWIVDYIGSSNQFIGEISINIMDLTPDKVFLMH